MNFVGLSILVEGKVLKIVAHGEPKMYALEPGGHRGYMFMATVEGGHRVEVSVLSKSMVLNGVV